MASPGLKDIDIDKIDDLEDMIEHLKKLGIYRKGLKSLDEMKALARKFQSTEKNTPREVQVRLILAIRFNSYHGGSPWLLAMVNEGSLYFARPHCKRM